MVFVRFAQLPLFCCANSWRRPSFSVVSAGLKRLPNWLCHRPSELPSTDRERHWQRVEVTYGFSISWGLVKWGAGGVSVTEVTLIVFTLQVKKWRERRRLGWSWWWGYGFCNWGHLNCFHTPSERMTRYPLSSAPLSVSLSAVLCFRPFPMLFTACFSHSEQSQLGQNTFATTPAASSVSNTLCVQHFLCHAQHHMFHVQHPLCHVPTTSVSQQHLCHNTLSV